MTSLVQQAKRLTRCDIHMPGEGEVAYRFPPLTDPERVTNTEAAGILGISRSAMIERCRRGQFDAHKVCGKWTLDKRMVEEFAAARNEAR